MTEYDPRQTVFQYENKNRKPVGEKAQWWLVPLDALVGEDDPLARYQSDPCVDTADACFDFFLNRLMYDRGKSWSEAMGEVIRAFAHGASKYEPDNWRVGASRREYLSAMCRHRWPEEPGFRAGDSGVLHDAHGACGALILSWHESRGTAGE